MPSAGYITQRKAHAVSLKLRQLSEFSEVTQERFEGLAVLDAETPRTLTVNDLISEFRRAFEEGLNVFFSPFAGFYIAVSNLKLIPAPYYRIGKGE